MEQVIQGGWSGGSVEFWQTGYGIPKGIDGDCSTGKIGKFGVVANNVLESRNDFSAAGGLLVIFGKEIKGNGSYQARGGGWIYTGNGWTTNASRTGGGSINIFGLDVSNINMNNIDSKATPIDSTVFSTGDGTYNVGSISTGIYIPRN